MPLIRKILVANRGEVALRVMKTARSLGIQTVAVYSTADAASAHVRQADAAVHIGDSAPAASYLNIPAIIEAARACGADAVHPGYGFLAENEDFARACRDAGLIFIGPPAEAIRMMGDKSNAKRLMREAGVPCVPGYDGEDQSPETLRREADRLGYPVMIKASAGGGGRGMRIVESPEAFAAALASAKSEAANAFSNDHVLLERVIVNPRHIEIQIMADSAGNAIHLGERDCSIQRRHQKIVEEAPGVGITPELRARMGEAAVKAAQAIGYEGAGTLEFLLDPSGEFYFMEMNTRLQVEHPVTEAITGLDLVALQIAVAQGETLPLTQDDVRFQGHAIEVRLCAEDEHQGFMPQSGTFEYWRAPQGVRVETAVSTGAEMSPFYDSMFAKIIARGETREQARRRLVTALNETVVFGVKTNKSLLVRCLEHPAFVKGGVDTGFLETHGADVLPARADVPATVVALAAAALVAHDSLNHHANAPARRRHVRIHLREAATGTVHELRVSGSANGEVEVAGGPGVTTTLTVHGIEAACMKYAMHGVSGAVVYCRSANGIELQVDGQVYAFEDVTYAAADAGGDGASDGVVKAAMNGRVVALFTEPGATVKAGDLLATVEAMKMEHQHCAPADGVVGAIHVAVGDQVTAGRALVEITLKETEKA